jgi:hypothetical protein
VSDQTPQDRFDAYKESLRGQNLTVDELAEKYYQWLVDNDITVVCTLPRVENPDIMNENRAAL